MNSTLFEQHRHSEEQPLYAVTSHSIITLNRADLGAQGPARLDRRGHASLAATLLQEIAKVEPGADGGVIHAVQTPNCHSTRRTSPMLPPPYCDGTALPFRSTCMRA